MKLIIRRKIAVPFVVVPDAVVNGIDDHKRRLHAAQSFTELFMAMRGDATKDGLESGDVLVEVTDGAE